MLCCCSPDDHERLKNDPERVRQETVTQGLQLDEHGDFVGYWRRHTCGGSVLLSGTQEAAVVALGPV